MFNTPILFIIFNREDTAKTVFNSIRKIKPKKLYIAADGARLNKEGEDILCENTRKITDLIDWPCEVFKKYSKTNLGCKVNMSEAITWFFENEESGIILEDDCLPDQSFYFFCQELLEKYKDIDRVKMISGNNSQFGRKYNDESYYFSNLPSIWGWATWKRAWKEYDINMALYPEFKKERKIQEIFKDKKIQKFMLSIFNKLYTNKMNTWAGRWVFAIYAHKGVCILPSVNLVSNIGFGADATHTKDDSILNRLKSEHLDVDKHPENIIVNEEADRYSFYKISYQSFTTKVLNRIKNYF